MFFGDTSEQDNEILVYLEEIISVNSITLEDVSFEVFEDFFLKVARIAVKQNSQIKDLRSEYQDLLKLRKENQELEQEVLNTQAANENIVIEYEDLKTLMTDLEDKYNKGVEDNNISRQQISALEKIREELQQQNHSQIQDYGTALETKNEEVSQLERQLKNKDNQIGQCKQKIQHLARQLIVVKELLEKEKQRCQYVEVVCSSMEAQIENLKDKNAQYEDQKRVQRIQTSFLNQLSDKSVGDVSNEAIIECSHEDDAGIFKQIEGSFHQDHLKDPTSSQDFTLKKHETGSSAKIPVNNRRNTINHGKGKSPLIDQIPKSNKKIKEALPMTSKKSIQSRNRLQQNKFGIRSTGNSPDSNSSQISKIFKDRKIIREQTEHKYESELKDLENKIKEAEKKIKQLTKQNNRLKEESYDRGDQTSQFQGHIEILETKLQKNEQQIFELKYALEREQKKAKQARKEWIRQKYKFDMQKKEAEEKFHEQALRSEKLLQNNENLKKILRENKNRFEEFHTGLESWTQKIIQDEEECNAILSPPKRSRKVCSQIQTQRMIGSRIQPIEDRLFKTEEKLQSLSFSDFSEISNHGHQESPMLDLELPINIQSKHELQGEIDSRFTAFGPHTQRRMPLASQVEKKSVCIQTQKKEAEQSPIKGYLDAFSFQSHENKHTEENADCGSIFLNILDTMSKKSIVQQTINVKIEQSSSEFQTEKTEEVPMKQLKLCKNISESMIIPHPVRKTVSLNFASCSSLAIEPSITQKLSYEPQCIEVTHFPPQKTSIEVSTTPRALTKQFITPLHLNSQKKLQIHSSNYSELIAPPEKHDAWINTSMPTLSLSHTSYLSLTPLEKNSVETQASFEVEKLDQDVQVYIPYDESSSFDGSQTIKTSRNIYQEEEYHYEIDQDSPESFRERNESNKFASQETSAQITPHGSRIALADKNTIKPHLLVEEKERKESGSFDHLRQITQERQYDSLIRDHIWGQNSNIEGLQVPEISPFDAPTKKKEKTKKTFIKPKIEIPLFPETLSSKQATFLRKHFLTGNCSLREQKIQFNKFQQSHGWNIKEIYVLEVSKIFKTGQNKDDKLVLWNKGLVSVENCEHMVATNGNKYINNSLIFIIGNSEIVIEKDNLSVRRRQKKKMFMGNMPDGDWKILRVSIYCK